jgi:hypothetical protein
MRQLGGAAPVISCVDRYESRSKLLAGQIRSGIHTRLLAAANFSLPMDGWMDRSISLLMLLVVDSIHCSEEIERIGSDP